MVWSVVRVSGPVVENVLVVVIEWIPFADMVKLCEHSSTVYAVLQEWFDDQILASLGDQTWIDTSKEWTEYMYGTAKPW